LIPKGDGLVKTGVSIGICFSNLRPVVTNLNLGYSGKKITALVFEGDLAWHLRKGSTH
jgi:hypothetical protein